jgi:fucose permease
VDRGLDEATASRWIAAYWGALTVGRLLLGSVGLRTTPGRLVAGSAAVALVGVTVLWLAPTSVASLGLVVVGAGFAGIFPALVALVPLRVGDAASPGAVGVGMAAASVGVAVGPAVVGRVAEVAGAPAIGPSLVAVTGLLLGVHLVATAVARGARPPVATTTASWPSVVAPEP